MADDKKFYGTVKEVIQSTGVKMDDLGFVTEEDLKEWIEARLVEIKDLIDRDRRRDYHVEAEKEGKEIPPGIHAIALRMMGNHIAYANLQRTTPIIRVDDFSIKMVEDQIFTSAIKTALRRYPAKPNFGFMVVKKK